MPAKKHGVITYREARVMASDASAMRYALYRVQVECGDREDDSRATRLNDTDIARERRELEAQEREQIDAIMRKLLDAYANRSGAR
jgi:hypothetical protein